MSTQATYITAARVALDDPNPPATIWTDTDLGVHVQKAVNEYTLWQPLEVKETGFTLTAGSRDIALSSLTPRLLSIRAVEYPTGNWPPTYVQFQLFATTLTLYLDGAPLSTDPLAVNLFCLEQHTVNNSSSSIQPAHDEIIIAGTVGFAAAEYAIKTAGQVNVAGPNSWQRYRELAVDRLNEFRGFLAIVRAHVSPNRLYAPAEPTQSRYVVDAPWRG